MVLWRQFIYTLPAVHKPSSLITQLVGDEIVVEDWTEWLSGLASVLLFGGAVLGGWICRNYQRQRKLQRQYSEVCGSDGDEASIAIQAIQVMGRVQTLTRRKPARAALRKLKEMGQSL